MLPSGLLWLPCFRSESHSVPWGFLWLQHFRQSTHTFQVGLGIVVQVGRQPTNVVPPVWSIHHCMTTTFWILFMIRFAFLCILETYSGASHRIDCSNMMGTIEVSCLGGALQRVKYIPWCSFVLAFWVLNSLCVWVDIASCRVLQMA